MPRLLLLLPTTTYRADDFVHAAGQLGIDLTVASEESSSVEAHNPNGLLSLDFNQTEQAAESVVAFSRKVPVHAVLGVDERTAHTAAVIASALSLPHNSARATSGARNKFEMRELLHKGSVPQPRYRKFSMADPPEDIASQITYPCVLKPLNLSASRGVIRANNASKFVEACQEVKTILHAPEILEQGTIRDEFLVENFTPGQEVALEGLVTKGNLHVLALFDKPDPLDGPFFEETIYVTPSRLDAAEQRQATHITTRAIRALGITDGPIHAELRVGLMGPVVIELAARSIGGRCSRALRFGTGMSLEEVVIRHVMGMEIPSLEREAKAAGVMMIPIPGEGVLMEVRGQEEARNVSGIESLEITAHKGQTLKPYPVGSPPYLGFIIARADSPEAVESALRESHRFLEILIARE